MPESASEPHNQLANLKIHATESLKLHVLLDAMGREISDHVTRVVRFESACAECRIVDECRQPVMSPGLKLSR